MDDNKGTSLVLLHSEKGGKLFSALSERIQCKKVSLEQTSAHNSSLLYSSQTKPDSEKVFRAALSGNFEAVENILQSATSKEKFLKRMLEKIRSAIK